MLAPVISAPTELSISYCVYDWLQSEIRQVLPVYQAPPARAANGVMSEEKPRSGGTTCAVMVLTGTMLMLTTHHAAESDVWSLLWVHVAADIIAVALVVCPILNLLINRKHEPD